MIKLINQGRYSLIETKHQIKILILEKQMYAWVSAKDIGEILVTSHKTHTVDHILSVGTFRLYEVLDEPHITDLFHLELFVGQGRWQGYLLPQGLPTDTEKRHRIITTKEKITKSLH